MMNNGNEISHYTMLYGFIGEEAGQSSMSATLNKKLKNSNRDAMMIPMNIREDDLYFTVANMKKSHVNGALISNEYVTSVIEILDDSSDIVKQSGMCDIMVREGEKLVGDVIFVKVLNKFLKDNGLNKIALIGTNHYAKAFSTISNIFDVSYYNDNLESLMSFVTDMGIQDADINRIAEGMEVDLSAYDAVLDFSELDSFEMLLKTAKTNIDLKQKKEFSALKIRAGELDALYYGFNDMLDEFSEVIFDFLKDKNHLDHDKSDMRF